MLQPLVFSLVLLFFHTNKIPNSESFFSNNMGCNNFSGFPSKLKTHAHKMVEI